MYWNAGEGRVRLPRPFRAADAETGWQDNPSAAISFSSNITVTPLLAWGCSHPHKPSKALVRSDSYSKQDLQRVISSRFLSAVIIALFSVSTVMWLSSWLRFLS